MKAFKLFLGARGLLGTYEITTKANYELVVMTIGQIRHHLRVLTDPVLRRPLLHIFQTVYTDNSKFPDHLKLFRPPSDQVPNQIKIQAIRAQPPKDADVIAFLTDAFPDLYLNLSTFSEDDILWGETVSGREAADKEEISINVQLVNLWLKAVSA
jgi:hypothetical protein